MRDIDFRSTFLVSIDLERIQVRRCRLTLSKPVLKPHLVSVLEATI